MVVVRSSIRPLLREVAEIVAGVLSEKGYRREEVSLLGSWNDRTGRLYLALLTSRPLSLETMQPLYGEVMNRFREQLDAPGDAPVTWRIGLIMGHEPEGRVTESPRFTVTPEEDDVSEFLLSEMDARWPPTDASPTPASKAEGSTAS